MAREARFVHVNLVARDWRALVRFYREVFGCVPVPPERDQSGAWLDAATSIRGLHIRGMHLRLPGYGAGAGPTLEIYGYDPSDETPPPACNRPGFGHLAFAVDDVEGVCGDILRAGGSRVGDTVTADIPDAGRIQFAYMRDPEGNILEIQRWT